MQIRDRVKILTIRSNDCGGRALEKLESPLLRCNNCPDGWRCFAINAKDPTPRNYVHNYPYYPDLEHQEHESSSQQSVRISFLVLEIFRSRSLLSSDQGKLGLKIKGSPIVADSIPRKLNSSHQQQLTNSSIKSLDTPAQENTQENSTDPFPQGLRHVPRRVHR